MFAHLLFIFAVSGYGLSIGGPLPDKTLLATTIKEVLFPFLSLFISHGISFFVNFIGRKEFKKTSIQQLMAAPYKRIIVMHLTLLLGGFIVIPTKAPAIVIILFIVLKTWADLIAHNKEHESFSQI